MSATATSRNSLSAFYQEVRSQTEKLCEPLEIEDFIPQPIVDVSPAKWNIAHTTWFFEEMILKRFERDFMPFDEAFGFLFNSYYNTIGERTDRDNRSLSRPTVSRVFEYRKNVDERMTALIEQSGDDRELADLITLGLNHEQQHQELFLTDIKYVFGSDPQFPVYRDDWTGEVDIESAELDHVDHDGGIVTIGHDGNGFCFDNELSRHEVLLRPFRISSRLVTNAEFLDFIRDGGYQRHELWHSEGWDIVKNGWRNMPMYWHEIDSSMYQFTLGGLVKLELNAPVCHVSFYEASAFAAWKGKRLPTEFEWEAASEMFDWGKRWEWTNSAYLPYPGFAKAAGAVGEYNGKFMVNQMVLRGSSIATPQGHSRPTYRNFFHPHLSWQFTGIRLAED